MLTNRVLIEFMQIMLIAESEYTSGSYEYTIDMISNACNVYGILC